MLYVTKSRSTGWNNISKKNVYDSNGRILPENIIGNYVSDTYAWQSKSSTRQLK